MVPLSLPAQALSQALSPRMHCPHLDRYLDATYRDVKVLLFELIDIWNCLLLLVVST
jgi:hypothetical protein